VIAACRLPIAGYKSGSSQSASFRSTIDNRQSPIHKSALSRGALSRRLEQQGLCQIPPNRQLQDLTYFQADGAIHGGRKVRREKAFADTERWVKLAALAIAYRILTKPPSSTQYG